MTGIRAKGHRLTGLSVEHFAGARLWSGTCECGARWGNRVKAGVRHYHREHVKDRLAREGSEGKQR